MSQAHWSNFFSRRLGRRRDQRKQSPIRQKLQLTPLEDRTVPTMLDLTVAGASGFINGGFFRDVNTAPAGSGNLHSFVRMSTSGGNGSEQGYNTDFRPYSVDPI